jgi:hypothetical protein
MLRKRLGKKAQKASAAAIFVFLLAVLLVAYVLVLPPQDRAELLGEDIGGGTSGTGDSDDDTDSKLLLDERVGRLDYLKFDERTHELPSFRIYTTVEATVLKTASSVYIKNSALGEESKQISFDIDKKYTDNLLLSFNVKESSGRLIVYLNGREIFNDKIVPSSPPPIVLPREYLMDQNTLRFETDSPGWLFWRVNEYTLTNLIIAADIEDVSKSFAQQRFHISNEEKDNLDRAVLWFYPDCQSTTGFLIIELNNREIFRAVPDCGVHSHVEVDPALLMSGENSFAFTTTEGSFLMDQIKLKTELEELLYPVYYFEIDDKYFKTSTKYTEEEEYCGNKDGVCPVGCDEDEDWDCCFEDNDDNYWCDIETDHIDDRCVGFVNEATLSRCPSGYEEENEHVVEIAEDLCGDDDDDYCPSGCSIYYDKDCCFEQDPDNYWCDDLPKTGVASICEQDISSGECDDCASGYYSEDRGRPSCGASEQDDQGIDVLKKEWDINLTMRFVDEREDHKAEIIVNGRTLHMDTNRRIYSRFIDDYVEEGTNSLEVIPRTTLDIVRLTVALQKH